MGYLSALVGGAGLFLALAIRAASRGALSDCTVQRAILRVPVLGPALQTMALSRLAWSMHLTMNAGMDLRSMRLSLRSTRNARYTDVIKRIDAGIAAGQSIYDTFCDAGCFPPAFLDILHTGEHSGRLVESMALLSRQYQEESRAALVTLTRLAGVAVWMVVAAFIIVLIFRLFGFYRGMLNGEMPK